jgi:hypothetical protein
MSFFYSYKGRLLTEILQPKSDTNSNNNAMTGYKTNLTDISFLKPFNTGTDNASDVFYPTTLGYRNADVNFQFCPKMVQYTTSSSDVAIPSGVTKMFVIAIGGGGGGGGGGVKSGSSSNGGSGGGGGGGALNAWWINVEDPTYSVTVGGGGSFGRPTNNTDVAEGTVATTGTAVKGASGGGGGSSSLIYSFPGSFLYYYYTSNGGAGGTGGAGSNFNTTGVGGAGGTGGNDQGLYTNNPTPLLSKAGYDASGGTNTNAEGQAGGRGGFSGNKDSTITYFLANYGILGITTTNYGNGGAGGVGESNSSTNWAGAGYNGRPGIVLVFYYYE